MFVYRLLENDIYKYIYIYIYQYDIKQHKVYFIATTLKNGFLELRASLGSEWGIYIMASRDGDPPLPSLLALARELLALRSRFVGSERMDPCISYCLSVLLAHAAAPLDFICYLLNS